MPAAFAFRYESRAPDGALGRLVESIWYARGTVPYQRERIAPTGSAVAVLVLGDPIRETPDDGHGPPFMTERGFLIGPHDRPVINEPLGETYAVGIVSTAVGCEAVFGVAPSSIRGRVVDLEATWGMAADLRRELLVAIGPARMLDLVEVSLGAEVAAPPDPLLVRCERAVRMLETDPSRPVAAIADALGVSHAQLDRDFRRVVGLSPRSVARLSRVRRLLATIDVRQRQPWAELAQEHGWFDQSHLIRDFRRHTGVTPIDYVEAQRAAFQPQGAGDSAGFVPEPMLRRDPPMLIPS